MRSTTLMTAALLALASPVVGDPPLADEVFVPLVGSKMIKSFDTDAGWEILDGGVERFDHTRVTGASWMLEALAMQIEPADAMPEVYLENVTLSTGQKTLVELEILAIFLTDDLLPITSQGQPLGQSLLAATPEAMIQACDTRNAPLSVSTMGEGISFIMDGFEVGKIGGFTSRLQILPGDEQCTLRTISQAANVTLSTPDGRETNIGVVSIVSEGPALELWKRSVSISLDKMTLERDDRIISVSDVSEVLHGSAQLSLNAALYNVATGKISAIHDAADIIASFADIPS